MNNKISVDSIINDIRDRILKKNGSYQTRENVFGNFDHAAGIMGTSREGALLAFTAKHIAKLYKTCNDGELTPEMIHEVAGDIACYMVILMSMFQKQSEPGHLGSIPR